MILMIFGAACCVSPPNGTSYTYSTRNEDAARMKWLRTYSWAISLLTLAREACSTGKGPGGIWPIDSRYTLLGDSNSNGLFVVDVVVGGIAAPPLTFERHARANGVAETRSRGWVSMTGVASCPTCKYLFVSSTHGAKFYRVDLPRTMEDMAKSRDFRAFVNASIVDLKFEGFGSTRMVTLTKDGKRGFIADYDKGAALWSVLPSCSSYFLIFRPPVLLPFLCLPSRRLGFRRGGI